MERRSAKCRGPLWWLLVCLAALWPAACMRHRAAGPDTYMGPPARTAGAPVEGGQSKGPAAPAAGAAPVEAAPEGPRSPDAPAPRATAGAGDEAPQVDQPVGQPAAPAPAAEGPLTVSLAQAIVMAMENNPELAVVRLEPQVLDTFAELEQAAFDPLVAGMIGHERVRAMDLSSGGDWFRYNTNSVVGEATLAKLFPTGTTVELGASSWVDDASRDGQQLIESRLGMTVSQALLRGAGTAVNLARVREARLDVLASEYEVRGFTEALISLVEQTYWDHALARRKIAIYEGSIALAEELLKDTQAKGRAGATATSDSAAAESEVALRRQDLVDVRSDMAKAKVLLLGFLSLPGTGRQGRDVRFVDELVMPRESPDDVESHTRAALRMRPDLNQARLLAQREELQVMRTRNGLLPQLDLFMTLGNTGYAETFGGAWKQFGGSRYDLLVGLSVEYPVGNHAAKAEHRRMTLTRRQAAHAIENIEQLAEVDVQTAHIEANRAREKAATVATTRRLDEEKLRIENERFRLGQASAFQVARAQRDLARRQVDEAEAVAEYGKALVELYRLDGTLLTRRRIEAPGAEPVGQDMGRP
ncbi:MAG: TolC family protein [Planctomycetes bacterium]|nr:TolC family protein [Planctomycetota bacterium]